MTKPWRNFETNVGHRNNGPDGHSYDGPSPSVLEQVDDAQYAGDFATMVACFRTEVAARSVASVMVKIASVLKHGPVLATEHWLADFHERWGAAAVLRALARSIEEPEHVVSDVVEHE